MSHYIAVLAPKKGGGWRAHFPDFPGCRAEGDRVEVAIAIATSAASDLIDQLNHNHMSVPTPRSYEVVRTDDGWARERGIDWSKCVISLVQVG